MQLSNRVNELKPSATMTLTALAESMQREGKDVIVLAAGQPDFSTPDFIKDAGKEALDKNYTRYTPVSGMPEFKEAIQRKFKRDNNLEYAMDEIIVGTGGKQVLYNAIHALLNPGDEALIPAPYWVSYPPAVELAGGVPVYLDTKFDDLFLVDPEKLKRAITERTKILFFNTPSNPTGTMYDKELMLEIGTICLENNVTVITDELYEYLVYDGETAYSLASLDPAFKKMTITVNGLSKAYAMTGWRIGYCGGPREIISAMGRIQSHSTSNASSIAQYAGITALSRTREELKEYFDLFEERRNISFDRLAGMKDIETFKPKGAFYIFPKVSAYYGTSYMNHEITDSSSFCKYMLEEQLISPVPGSAFGNDDHVRISYSVGVDDLNKALDRFEEGLNKLQ